MFSIRIAAVAFVAGVFVHGTAAKAEEKPGIDQPNQLKRGEAEAGWKLLFDGKTTNGWRAFRGKEIPDVWKVVDGALVCSPKNGKHGGDIVTENKYGNIELSFEWKVTPGANSGVMYRVSEDEDEPWKTGPEYQVLDNSRHPDGRKPKTTAASCYALYAPEKAVTKPVGEWNQGKIVMNGNHIEHWLNGRKVVEYEVGSPDWNERFSKSKFRIYSKFAKEVTGHVDLQFHGDEVAFRNIKVRELGTVKK
jgi:hypothetical protein